MRRAWHPLFGGLLVIVLVGCNHDTSMNGHNDRTEPAKIPQTSDLKPAVATPPANTTKNASDPIATDLEPTPTPPPKNQVESTQPDNVVDGQEVYNDCQRCVQRAQALSPLAGFQADASRTANLGFYKIAQRFGLCDIHFMANLYDRIEDHEGHDSVLRHQVALYCPCTCPWTLDMRD